MKRNLVLFLLFCSLLLAGTVQAVDLKEAQKIEDAVAKCVTQIRALLLPFGAKAGFPETKPHGLENASYQKLYRAAARSASQGSRIMSEFVENNKNIPYSLEFSARYFMKRLEIAAHEYADMSGNEKVFHHLCREFAADCDRGFEELRFWAVPEMLVIENIWFKNIQAAFVPVKAKLEKAVMPESIAPAEAREVWKQTAAALSEAGNAAGIASTKVGAGGLIGMPAWRLRLAIKYFKASCKAAVIQMWHSSETDTKVWSQACNKLREEIAIINTEINNFLAMYGGNPSDIRPVMYLSPAAATTSSSSAEEEIEIKASASDKGIKLKAGFNHLKIMGIAEGPETAYDIMGIAVGDYARGVRFTLDIDKAPTTNVFGQKDYSMKNRRIFQVMTSKGATAEQIARLLARKVNDARDFRAKLFVDSSDSAQLNFSHR